MYTQRSNTQVCQTIISPGYLTTKTRNQSTKNIAWDERVLQRVCLFHNRRYNSEESSLSCTNNLMAKKHLLFKALVLAGYLIKHLFTNNILQQNRAECQIYVYKAWSQLKKTIMSLSFHWIKRKWKKSSSTDIIQNTFRKAKESPTFLLQWKPCC